MDDDAKGRYWRLKATIEQSIRFDELGAFFEAYGSNTAVFAYLAERSFLGLVWRPVPTYLIILPVVAKREGADDYIRIRPFLLAGALEFNGASREEADRLVARCPDATLAELTARIGIDTEYLAVVDA
jgi:hypothetical protein